MSITREQVASVVADAVAEHFERLRSDMLEKMLQLRAPRWSLTPMGELYCDGERVGDVRPVFQRVVAEALQTAKPKEGDGDDDGT